MTFCFLKKKSYLGLFELFRSECSPLFFFFSFNYIYSCVFVTCTPRNWNECGFFNGKFSLHSTRQSCIFLLMFNYYFSIYFPFLPSIIPIINMLSLLDLSWVSYFFPPLKISISFVFLLWIIRFFLTITMVFHFSAPTILLNQSTKSLNSETCPAVLESFLRFTCITWEVLLVFCHGSLFHCRLAWRAPTCCNGPALPLFSKIRSS